MATRSRKRTRTAKAKQLPTGTRKTVRNSKSSAIGYNTRSTTNTTDTAHGYNTRSTVRMTRSRKKESIKKAANGTCTSTTSTTRKKPSKPRKKPTTASRKNIVNGTCTSSTSTTRKKPFKPRKKAPTASRKNTGNGKSNKSTSTTASRKRKTNKSASYTPGTRIKWGKWYWCCLCDEPPPPPTEWKSGACLLECCECLEKAWGHIDCYGLLDLYKNDKVAFSNFYHQCAVCMGMNIKQIQIHKGQVIDYLNQQYNDTNNNNNNHNSHNNNIPRQQQYKSHNNNHNIEPPDDIQQPTDLSTSTISIPSTPRSNTMNVNDNSLPPALDQDAIDNKSDEPTTPFTNIKNMKIGLPPPMLPLSPSPFHGKEECHIPNVAAIYDTSSVFLFFIFMCILHSE